MTARTVLTALLVLGLALAPAAADSEQIILTAEDRERIDLAKSRFDELIKRLKEAQDIEKDAKAIGFLDEDQGIADDIGKGIKLIEFAKKLLDHGVATADFLDKVITWHTAVSCLSQATNCMTQERDAACIRSYAYGMSRLFLMVHEELKREPFDFDKYDWKKKISLEYALFAAFGELTQHYVAALEVAGNTFNKASMWSQICKTRATCDAICSSGAETAALFDCPTLQNANMSQPMCVTLKGIVEGTLTEKSAQELIEIERASKYFLAHSDKVAFQRTAAEIAQFVDSHISNLDTGLEFRNLKDKDRSRMKTEATRAKSLFDAAVAAVDAALPPVIEAQNAEDLALLKQVSPPLIDASCRVQEAAVEVYAVTLNDQARFERLLRNAQGVAACKRHGQHLREIQSRDPVDCLGGQCG